MSNMKSVKDAHIGDTFFKEGEKVEPYPGYEKPQSVVYAGIYPESSEDYEDLHRALDKLCLSDGSVEVQFESSAALGSGFRCGFLGLLHMDVFRQRLQEEYDIYAIVTQPNVSYYCKNRGIKADWVRVDNPVDCPDTDKIEMW